MTSHAKSKQVAQLEKDVSDALSLVTVAIGFQREHLEDLEGRVQILEYPDCTGEEGCTAEGHRIWCPTMQAIIEDSGESVLTETEDD